MFTAFSTSLTALQADSSAISVIGNDLANLNTTGYKAEQVQFEDLMAQSLGTGASTTQVGLGVGPILTAAEYTQGTLTSTGGPLDAAIQGNGFFMVQDPSSNQTLYTRDGSFQLNSSGELVTATGQLVQGWSAVDGVVNTNGAVGDITVPQGTVIQASATENMAVRMNLDASAGTTGTDSTFSAPIQVVDSQGTSHTLTINFQKTAANTWTYTVTIPPSDLGSSTGTGTGTGTGSGSGSSSTSAGTLATGTLNFDGNGNLITGSSGTSSPVTINISGLADGANAMTINWNLVNSSGASTITQYAEASSVGSTSQDGTAAGQIENVNLENGGVVEATYSNGQQATIGQLALASIANPDSLESVGDNNLAATASTAVAAVGAAGSGGRGSIVAGSLESSNVDIATEFTNLLTYERSYQAASRVITTSDQLLQETVDLIHP